MWVFSEEEDKYTKNMHQNINNTKQHWSMNMIYVEPCIVRSISMYNTTMRATNKLKK